MNRFKQNYYNDVSSIKNSLKRIANALENNNLTAEEAHNVKHAFTGLDGKQVDEKYEAEQARLYTDDIKAQDDALNKETANEHETNVDYLHQLVQGLDALQYQEFCNTHCLCENDAVEVSNYITDLDYSEVLGTIKELEAANNSEIPGFEGTLDALENLCTLPTYETDLQGIRVDSDHDIRSAAHHYESEIGNGDIKYKKDAILDYITNEFGLQGARYTDIIKFAYYLGNSNGAKFTTRDRGYYSCAISGNNAHLTKGGNDFLVKGINNDGLERYFAHSFVDEATGFWKYIK
tara:strand:+ start:443 stop:1318 length:876 start_codon:yes stop_codon:yes gene_type:complete